MKRKKIIFIIALLIILIGISTVIIIDRINSKTATDSKEIIEKEQEKVEKETQENKGDDKIDIIDVNSKTRPYAIVVNNTPVAVKVQTGLNKAYIVYEFPTEGNTSRLMALYKDINEDLTVGTTRSARHNFIDYALESDAIFVHFGWSKFAQADEKAGSINYLNGLFDTPFWRENPENLAVEHTAYTSLGKIKQAVEKKGYKTETNTTTLLNYNTEDVDLSKIENAEVANTVTIPYGSSPNITSFKYDSESKMYNRIENGTNCIDHKTKEQVNTKNIIIQKINHTEGYKESKYWDLHTIGTGKGWFITNGYAVPIKWSKTSRNNKTKYTYLDGKEIEVSDGRTYIEIQTTKQNLIIE